MKNTRKCPKCGGSDILFVPGSAGAYGTGNNIMTGNTIMSAVPVDRYICTRCCLVRSGLTLTTWIN